MGRRTKGLEDWLRIDAKLVCADISQTIFRCCEATLHIHNTTQTSLPRRNKLNEAPIHEKEKAVENQPLCFVVGIGYCARFCSLRLTPFPSACRGGLNKITSQGVDKSTTLFLLLYPYKQVCRDLVSKIKDVEFLRHLLASFFL